MAVLWCVRVTENLAKISRVPVWEMAARQDVRVTECNAKNSRDARHQYSVSRSRPFPAKVARPRGPAGVKRHLDGAPPHHSGVPSTSRPVRGLMRTINDYLHAS